MKICWLIVLICAGLMGKGQGQNVLKTISFPSLTTSTQLPTNLIGLSLSFDQVYSSALTSTVFKQYIKNGWAYGSTTASWGISIKMQYPPGFKYDCASWTMINFNAVCTVDVLTYYPTINTFFHDTSNSASGLSFGFDREGTLVTDFAFNSYFLTTYFFGFLTAIQPVGGRYPSLQMFDQANNYNSFYAYNITPNAYSSGSFMTQYQALAFMSPTSLIGPGTTQNATIDWMDTYSTMFPSSIFSVYMETFKTDAELTNSNILNQANYQPLIASRFATSTGTLNPVAAGVIITDLKMASTAGIDGVTNGMISAIWGLDTLIECAKFGISGVKFNVDLNSSSLQGPFGPQPDYTPQPLYYAMLMMSIIQQDMNTRFITPTQTAGTSSSIKVHSFLSGDVIGLVLINKDVNTSASGTVFVESTNRDPMSCIYLSSSSLNSKTVTLAGLSFVGNNSVPQGTFTEIKFNNTNGTGFSVTLNHAEAAYCRLILPSLTIPSYNTVPDSYLWEKQLFFAIVILFVFLMF